MGAGAGGLALAFVSGCLCWVVYRCSKKNNKTNIEEIVIENARAADIAMVSAPARDIYSHAAIESIEAVLGHAVVQDAELAVINHAELITRE